jgi:cytidine deaminase
MEDDELVAAARVAREGAYAPYSHYAVGAALRTRTGKVYTGANVENASFGLSVCAERVAAFKAVTDGEREFEVVAVVTENGGSPCGACRQVLSEFGQNARVIVADMHGGRRKWSLSELLPDSFGPDDFAH